MSRAKGFNKIYIDALALVPSRKSGIGITLQNLLANMIKQLDPDSAICLVVPLWKAKYLKDYTKYDNVSIKTIYLPARVMEVMLRLRLMPPIDWFIGTGVYLFPNYRNWPLWRSRSLTYVYDVSFIKVPDMVQPKNQHYLSKYIRRWTSRADAVITISEQVRNELEKHLSIPYQKIYIVPCGVDAIDYHKRSQAEIVSMRQKYEIRFEKYLLFVGNIEPRKNLTALLDAYTLLPFEVQKTYGLVIVGGDGWLNEDLHAKMNSLISDGLQICKVSKYVTNEDLPALYSGASLLVHPAFYEGFGITPLEAMACDVPVVVSDLPALHEVVGDAGLYFNPANPSQIAQSIVQALGSPKTLTLARKARVDRFSWGSAAKTLIAVVGQYQKEGPRRMVLLRNAQNTYLNTDRIIREFLGEKPPQQYKPNLVKDAQLQYEIILKDFFREQPSALQAFSLRGYLASKNLIARPIKKAVRLVLRSRA